MSNERTKKSLEAQRKNQQTKKDLQDHPGRTLKGEWAAQVLHMQVSQGKTRQPPRGNDGSSQ